MGEQSDDDKVTTDEVMELVRHFGPLVRQDIREAIEQRDAEIATLRAELAAKDYVK